MAYRLLFFTFFLCFQISCSTSQTGEGFYYLGEVSKIPTKKISLKVLKEAQQVTGAFSSIKKIKVQRMNYELEKLKYCTHPETQIWFSRSCKELQSCIDNSKKECHLNRYAQCGGVPIQYKNHFYFVTAGHCTFRKKVKDLRARFLSQDKKSILSFKLDSTKALSHTKPYDISILKILNWDSQRPLAKISPPETKGSAVFGIGFPSTRFRNRFSKNYATSNNEMRVTFGKIIEPNFEKKSFCHFSNNIVVAKPLSWKLESQCKQTTPHSVTTSKGKYQARVEKNPLITNTDMINGMSGSPLFSELGNFIGIGTTVLKEELPLNYGYSNHAVYVKAENIQELLSEL